MGVDVGGQVCPAVAARNFKTSFYYIEVHRIIVVASIAAVGLKPVEELLHIDIEAAAGRQVALTGRAVRNERVDVVARGGIVTFPEIESISPRGDHVGAGL